MEEEIQDETIEEELESPEEYTESLNGFVDLERTKETIFYTPSGDIHLIHSITLGEVLNVLLLTFILIFLFLSHFRR